MERRLKFWFERKPEVKDAARLGILKLCSWMKHSRFGEIKKAADTLKVNLEAILACWDFRCTNALLEGLNSIIQNIKRRARGFRTVGRFKTMVMPACGKLGLVELCPYPRLSPKA